MCDVGFAQQGHEAVNDGCPGYLVDGLQDVGGLDDDDIGDQERAVAIDDLGADLGEVGRVAGEIADEHGGIEQIAHRVSGAWCFWVAASCQPLSRARGHSAGGTRVLMWGARLPLSDWRCSGGRKTIWTWSSTAR